MAQGNLETVKRVMEALVGGAPETALAHVHPDVEFDASVRPDGKVWHGREGVRQAMLEWTATWSDWQLYTERYIEAGDDKVAVLWHETGRAIESGALVSQQGATVLSLRDGLIVSAVISLDRERTLAALGLEQ